jgi:hypothetical protein
VEVEGVVMGSSGSCRAWRGDHGKSREDFGVCTGSIERGRAAAKFLSVSDRAGVRQERGQMGNEGEGTRQGRVRGFVL